jgi:hypothetical protein
MKKLLLASLAWLAASAHPSDELRRERLPADVDFVVHIDVEGFKQTQLWKHVREEGEDMDLDIEELDDIREDFGIDPLTDVRAITLYKVESEEEPTVVLFSSNAKVDEALVRLQKEREYRRVVSSGIELHTWSDSGDDDECAYAYVHAVGAERVVVLASSESSAVRAARVLRGQDPSHASAGTLLTLAPARGSFLYLAAAEIPHLHEFTPASPILGLAQGIQVDLGEAGGFLRAHMGVTTGSPQDALDISNVVNGLMSIVRLAGAEAGEALELLTGLRLSTRGSEVTVDFEFAVDRLLEIARSYDEDERERATEDDEEGEHERREPRKKVKVDRRER